jgi:hypothetical protein
MPIVDPKHPLATGLRSLWLPSLDAGESRLTNYARGEAETMAFPATVGERPAWAVGSVGPALDFDGINDYLSTTNLPWQPLTEGGNITVAVYAEVFAYPTSSTTELWSSQYAPGTADRVIATLGLRASSSTLRARINLNEPGGSSGGPSIAWPPLRTPFLAVFTSRSEFDHELATFAPGQGVPSFALDTTGRQPLASFNPTSEVIGNEIYAGATDAAFSGRIYGVWVWNRGFTRSDITSFLLDPFGLVAVPRLGAGISQAASFDAQAVSAGTLTTTWSLAAGAASSSAIATGASPLDRMELRPRQRDQPGRWHGGRQVARHRLDGDRRRGNLGEPGRRQAAVHGLDRHPRRCRQHGDRGRRGHDHDDMERGAGHRRQRDATSALGRQRLRAGPVGARPGENPQLHAPAPGGA